MGRYSKLLLSDSSLDQMASNVQQKTVRDPNIFAILTSHGSSSPINFAHKTNKPHFCEATISQDDLNCKETTPLDGDSNPRSLYKEHLDRIVLRFDQLPLNRHGWRFGGGRQPSQTCDIIMHNLFRLSRRQFYITLDNDLTPYLIDESRNGTYVMYNGESGGLSRPGGKWVLALDPARRQAWKHTVIEMSGYSLCIEFPNHENIPENAGYMTQMQSFLDMRQDALPPMECLGINSSNTTALDTAQAFLYEKTAARYHKDKKIGKGNDSVVYRVVDVTTGKYFAMKQFTRTPRVKTEVNIMEKYPHVCIVKRDSITS